VLYFIVAIKLIKGVLLLLVALGIFALAGKDLQDLFEHFVHGLGFDPENRFFSNIGDWLDTITPANVRVVASGTFLCGLFLIVLAWDWRFARSGPSGWQSGNRCFSSRLKFLNWCIIGIPERRSTPGQNYSAIPSWACSSCWR